MLTPPPIPADPFHKPSFDNAARVAGAVRLKALTKRPTDWLWPRRIPIGKVTLLVGDPGLGKSLVALDIAARVSTGAPWPDACVPQSAIQNPQSEMPSEPRTLNPSPSVPQPSTLDLQPSSVLLLNAEDDLAGTILPRLEALGADCDKIVAIPSFLGSSGDGSSRDGSIPRDHELRRDLSRLRSILDTLPDCRLIVVDPISAYLSGNGNTAGEVRSLFVPLAELAEERRLAILVISHLRKQSGSAIHRTMGSLSFITAARAAWIICEDPADSDRRLLLPVKCNLASRTPGLAYTIESTAEHRAGESEQPESYAFQEMTDAPPTIRWSDEPVDLSADDGLLGRIRPYGRPKCERGEAARWLQTALAAGPRPVTEVEKEAIANGFRLITLQRAFRDLDGKATRVGFGPLGVWFWQLPGVGDQNLPTTLDDLWKKGLGLGDL